MAKRKKTKRGTVVKRRMVTLRMPTRTIDEMDLMSREVGMSRNALITLLLNQSAAMHRADREQPELFADTEALIEGALRRAFEKGADK